VKEDELVPGSVAAHEFHRTARASQLLCQESQQRLIRSRIHGRGGHFNLQFTAQNSGDLIFGSAWLEPDQQANSAGSHLNKAGNLHHGA